MDLRVALGYHVYPNISLAALVDALLERVEGRHELPTPAPRQVYPRGLTADQQTIMPTDVAKAVNDLMDRVGRLPIAADMGDCLFTALEMENTLLVAPGYYATMGFGVPAGLGLQAATGMRPLVLVGDGAFQMTGWELGNCSRYGWDPIVLLFNNKRWEMLHVFQPESAFNQLQDWHFATMAKALGGDGLRVRSRIELRDALNKAFATRGKFQLIEVMLPEGALSDVLSRFVKGISRQQAGRPVDSAPNN